MSYDEDLNVIKEDIARKLGISLSELEEELTKIRTEAPGLISEKLGLLLLLERKGIVDTKLIKKLSSDSLFFSIVDLAPGMQGITVIGRIQRFLRTKDSNELSILIIDNTGKAIVTIRGRNVELFKKIGFDVGDLLMIKNARVPKSSTFIKKIIVDDDSEIYYLDETDVAQYQIGMIPKLSQTYSVKGIINIAQDLIDSNVDINVRGVVSWLGSLTEKNVNRQRKIYRFIFRIRDENYANESIRVVAWGGIAKDLHDSIELDDIILLEGCIVKENKYLKDKTGRQALELHLGNLSNFKILGVEREKISDLVPGIRSKIFAFNLSQPKIKSFISKDGERKCMLYCPVGDESGILRLVVWRPDIIEHLRSLEYGSKLMIVGVIKRNKFDENKLEIHVSTDKDQVIINPKKWPSDLEIEMVKKLDERDKTYKKIEIISDFSQIPLSSTVSVEGYLDAVRRTTKREGPLGIAKLVDKNSNELILMIWNEDIVKTLENTALGTLIQIRNARTPKEQRADTNVLFVGKYSKIVLKDKTKNIKNSEKELDVKPLSETNLGDAKIFGTITDVLFIGEKHICPKCGLPIITKAEEGDVCPRGHLVKSVMSKTLIILIDDEIKNAKVILTRNLVDKIVRDTNINFDELMDNNIIDFFKLKLIGKEIVLSGEVSEESLETDYLVIAKEILDYDVNTLKKTISVYATKDDEPSKIGL